MLIKDIMTKKVITAPSSTSIGDAKKIMKENRFRRIPVVDDGKLVGIVTDDRLDRVSPTAATPLLWQIGYLISHTTLADIMEKNVVTIEPEATVEQGVALAQSRRVGSLVVVQDGKVVGIVTTNDFFYNVVNRVLGLGEPGTRIIIPGGGESKAAEKIIARINKLGIGIKVIWTMSSPGTKRNDVILHLNTEDTAVVTRVINELQGLGYAASIRPTGKAPVCRLS